MTDDTYQQLWAEVMACPDSDEPRLVLADYLEELADPRAEFIRVQCELAATDRRSRRHYELSERSKELLAENEQEWLKPLPKFVRKLEFRRGFASEATMTAKPLAKQPSALMTAPFDCVRLNRLKEMGSAIANLQELNKVRGLDVRGLVVPQNDLLALLCSPHWSSLQRLHLSGIQSEMNADVGEALGQGAFCPTLQTLSLHHAPEDDFWPALAQGEGFPELRELALGMEFQPLAQQCLNSWNVPKLEKLVLRGASLPSDGVSEFELLSLPLPQIRRLDLRGVAFEEHAIEAMAAQGAFDDVVELDVSNHALTVDAVRAVLSRRVEDCRQLRIAKTHNLSRDGQMDRLVGVLAETTFKQLNHLELASLRDMGLIARLLGGESMQALRSLEVDEVAIGREDMKALCGSVLSQSLRVLELTGVQLHDEAFEEFGALPELLILNLSAGHHRWEFPLRLSEALLVKALAVGKLPSLRELHLNETGLTDVTMHGIASCPHLSELRVLSFRGNRTTDEAVHAVLQSDHLPKLRALDVHGTKGMKNRPKLRKQYGERFQA